MAWRKAAEPLVALFDDTIPYDPRIERRKMFGCPAAFAGGRLFAGVHQESIFLKLSAEDRREAHTLFGALPFEPMPGRRMREYVVLPLAMVSDRALISAWLSRSLAYVVTQVTAPAPMPARTSNGKGAARPKRASPPRL